MKRWLTLIFVLLSLPAFAQSNVNHFTAIGLPNSTSVTVGTLSSGSTVFYHNFQPLTFTDGQLFVGISSNVFLGPLAGNFAILNDGVNLFKGGNNVAMGAQAMNGLTMGWNNVAFGSRALFNVTTGQSNAAIGYEALRENTTGSFNMAVGAAALQNMTSGASNVGVGNITLWANTTGSSNTAIGHAAGYTEAGANANVSGANNVWLGREAGPGTTTQLTNSIGVGYRSHPTASNQAVFGNSSITATQLFGTVSSTGVVLLPDGTLSAPATGFTSETALGFYRSSAGQLTVANANVSGGVPYNFGTSGFQMGSNMLLSWSNATSALSGGGDVVLMRDAANVLAQRNGTSAQLQRVYNTFTDSSNYERADIGWNAAGIGVNKFGVFTTQAGTGIARALTMGTLGSAAVDFYTNNTARWEINTSGHLISFGDSQFDIGAAGTNRPRNAFLGGTITAGAGASLGYSPNTATNSSGPRLTATWLPRLADLSANVMLDYQDEYAYIDGRGVTVSTTPASTSGAPSDMFHDDSQSLNWAAGVTGGQVQITIDHSTGAGIVPNRNNGSYQIGLTFRSDFIGPGHIKIESWTTAAGGSFSTVYDADVTIFGGAFGAWVSPLFVSPDPSFNIYKTRLTLSQLPDPTTGNFRVQRVQLYHATAPWDPFHLSVGGGTLYGALNFAGTAGADTTITRSAAGKLTLTGGTTPMLQFGGTTSSFTALKGNGAQFELRLADDSGYARMIANQFIFASNIAASSGNIIISNTSPGIASGFGTSPSVTANGTAAFIVNVGSGGTASSGVLTMPAATNGWICNALLENQVPTIQTKQSASSTTSVTLTNYTVATGATAAWAANQIVRVTCMAY